MLYFFPDSYKEMFIFFSLSDYYKSSHYYRRTIFLVLLVLLVLTFSSILFPLLLKLYVGIFFYTGNSVKEHGALCTQQTFFLI